MLEALISSKTRRKLGDIDSVKLYTEINKIEEKIKRDQDMKIPSPLFWGEGKGEGKE